MYLPTLTTPHYDNIPGGDKEKLVVLLCAPSTKAAFQISGMTLHTVFALLITQFRGLMPELSSDIANTIREQFINLKLIVNDEISMVSSTLLSHVDSRLRKIMGINCSFGGISVIAVRDLHQFPAVMNSPI